jgi:hypothetical protein
MNEKTKIVEIGGQRYQIRRFAPNVGSYILMQMIGAGLKGQNFSEAPPAGSASAPSSSAAEPNGEDTVRAIVFAAFLRGLEYDMHNFVQNKCLAICALMKEHEGTELPVPLTNGSEWVPEIRDDMQLVMKLEVEAMVFNFSDFFAEGGLNALAGKRPLLLKE